MTRYSGPILVHLSGFVEGEGSFVGDFAGVFTISDLVLGLGGALSGNAGGGGTLTMTVTTVENGTETQSDLLDLGVLPLSTSLSQIGLPLIETVPEFGIIWSQTNSFDPLRTVLTIGGSASFDAVFDGYHVFGTASVSGAFAATSSAYSIAALDAVAGEGTGFGGAYSFTVTRRGSVAGSSSVTWAVAGEGVSPVTASDFAGGFLPSGMVEFADGETSRTISVTVAGDSSFEPDEGFSVTLGNAPGEVIVVTQSAGATVQNDDATSIISITALDADHAEGQSGSSDFTFTLSRTGDVSGNASVGWVSGGDGVRPADDADFAGAAAPNGTVSFAPGEVAKTVTVQVVGDTAREGNEGFRVVLVPQSGADLGTGLAVGLIRADEALDDIIVVDVQTGLALAAAPSFYAGPVAGLERELLAIVGQNVTVVAGGPNWFVHTGGGDDAIRVQGGRNVLDGGTGSNFLTGAGGEDTFFLDARGQTLPIWSTLVDFGAGDSATIWGLTQSSATLLWQDGGGAPGFTGLTMHALLPGHPFASLTLPGYSSADLSNGRLSLTSGHDIASDSDFIFLVGA